MIFCLYSGMSKSTVSTHFSVWNNRLSIRISKLQEKSPFPQLRERQLFFCGSFLFFHSLIRIRIRPDPHGSGWGSGCKRTYNTLAVLQPTYISSWGLVMCLGCAAAAPTGAAVTGVVLLLKKIRYFTVIFFTVFKMQRVLISSNGRSGF